MNTQRMNMNRMIDNARKDRMGATMCQLDITKNLANRPDYNDNSWFAYGRYEVETDHYINFMFHIMGM